MSMEQIAELTFLLRGIQVSHGMHLVSRMGALALGYGNEMITETLSAVCNHTEKSSGEAIANTVSKHSE